MKDEMDKDQMKKQMVIDLVRDNVRDLQELKVPKDFSLDDAYNLMMMAIQFQVTAGGSFEKVMEELHLTLNEAGKDFLDQILEE
jgi:hypothetical protein